jgi:ABC-type cobalamin/Fe3+-siderophores transport system ATPase subunit
MGAEDANHPGLGSPLVEARGLGLGYGGAPIVSGLYTRYARGEGPLGLCGPNGSGKSSFLKACLGLLKPIAGDLEILGERAGTSAAARALSRVGYVPQQRPAARIGVTVREAASMGREAQRGLLRSLLPQDREAVDRAMERTGIAERAERQAHELSGGQYQRLLIARALAMEPELLILDEPSAHLDRESRKGVIETIEALADDRSAGMLLVTHDRELLSHCARYLVFADGSAREEGSPPEDLDA